jgi:hypothetical protein
MKHLLKFEKTPEFFQLFHRLSSRTRVKWQGTMLDPHMAIPFRQVPDMVEYVGLDNGILSFVAGNRSAGDNGSRVVDINEFEQFALKGWGK